jgi:hypothetical protein
MSRAASAHSRIRLVLSLTISILTFAFNLAIVTFGLLIYWGVQ